MATFSKTILSGSTDGKAINITATSSPGTTIHTGSSTAADLHEIWLWAANYTTTATMLSIQWGGTAAADEVDVQIDPYAGWTPVANGLLLKGNATPLVIRAFAGTTNALAIVGFVNVIS